MDANEDLYSDYDYDIGGFGSAPSSNPFQPKTPGFPASRMGTASRLRTAGGSEVRPMTSTTGSGFSSKPGSSNTPSSRNFNARRTVSSLTFNHALEPGLGPPYFLCHNNPFLKNCAFFIDEQMILVWGRPYMTSDDFCPLLTPPSPPHQMFY